MAVDPYPVLWPGHPLCCCHDTVRDHVQELRLFQYRYRALHELAVPAMGDQAAMVALYRYVPHQAFLDYRLAAGDRCGAVAGSLDHSPAPFLPDQPGDLLADGLQFGHA